MALFGLFGRRKTGLEALMDSFEKWNKYNDQIHEEAERIRNMNGLDAIRGTSPLADLAAENLKRLCGWTESSYTAGKIVGFADYKARKGYNK